MTDSIYVVLNMDIMTHVGQEVIELLNQGAEFTRCLHSKAQINEQEKYIAHFPEDNTIWSINSAYGGNVLLGKKCLALRIGSYLGKQEGWMADQMLILKIENKEGEAKYVCGAFPSCMWKDQLAMLTPPDYFKKLGYKVSTIGDDISWLRIGSDGRLYAVNPENGFFGVAPGTNEKSNPNALKTTRKIPYLPTWRETWMTIQYGGKDLTIIRLKTVKTGWVTRGTGRPPRRKALILIPDLPRLAVNCPIIAPEFSSGEGVPISAIIFGGEEPRQKPLVYQQRHGPRGIYRLRHGV